MSLSLIYAVLRSGKLRAMRLGCRGRGCWRIDPEDFETWLDGCKIGGPPQEDEGSLKFIK